MTHIVPLIRCYASQTHHSRWECATQQFGLSCFHAVKISHDGYYFCSSHVALYLVIFLHRSPFIHCSWGDIWYFLRCCFDSHGNYRPIAFSAVGVGQDTWCLLSFLELFRCKMLQNVIQSVSSFRCGQRKSVYRCSRTRLLCTTKSFKPHFLLLCDNRPPHGHSDDRPRDAALREHHGQIHHPAPPAQLPHWPV